MHFCFDNLEDNEKTVALTCPQTKLTQPLTKCCPKGEMIQEGKENFNSRLLISHYDWIQVRGCVISQMLRHLLLKSISQITRLKKNFSHPLNISRQKCLNLFWLCMSNRRYISILIFFHKLPASGSDLWTENMTISTFTNWKLM